METSNYTSLFRRGRDTDAPPLTLNSRFETEANKSWLDSIRKIQIGDWAGMWRMCAFSLGMISSIGERKFRWCFCGRLTWRGSVRR